MIYSTTVYSVDSPSSMIIITDTMAKRKLQQEVPDDLTCSLCLESFTTPKVLQCGHTFCLDCLTKHVQSCSDTHSFPCPLCLKMWKLSETTLQDLPNNYIAIGMIESLECSSNTKKSDDERRLICGYCEESETVVSYCKPCSIWLCSICTKGHKKYPGFSRHEIVTSETYTQQYREIAACKLCVLRDLQGEWTTRLKELTNNSEELSKHCIQIKSEISADAISAHLKISSLENDLIAKVDDFQREKKEYLVTVIDGVRTQLASSDSFQGLLSQMEHCDDVKLLQNTAAEVEEFIARHRGDVDVTRLACRLKWEPGQCEGGDWSSFRFGNLVEGETLLN